MDFKSVDSGVAIPKTQSSGAALFLLSMMIWMYASSHGQAEKPKSVAPTLNFRSFHHFFPP